MAYGAKTTPQMYVIDPEGLLLYNGAIDDRPSSRLEDIEGAHSYLVQAIEEAMAGEPVTRTTTQPYGCSVKYGPTPEAAPPFTLPNQAGEDVSLADYAGKIVVLEWVNPDCPYVKRHYEAGTMKTLAEEFADRGVVWLSINSTHYMDAEASAAFKEAEGLPYDLLVDADGKVGHLYEAKTTPDIRIIDIDGSVVYRGAIDSDPRGNEEASETTNYVRQALSELLSGQEVSTPRAKPYGCSVKYAK